jgi:hypothetical protein
MVYIYLIIIDKKPCHFKLRQGVIYNMSQAFLNKSTFSLTISDSLNFFYKFTTNFLYLQIHYNFCFPTNF